ncbi:hypothetical protein DYB32_003673 [Aphanomyces invadans]|uniref:LTD domain-containing protein n=1 Tax=Aphanomyces invadans TaxID=157072 RepID=A0A3R6YAW6_9STRA|nr:hypothetical protein DYB32_003673 [Aphanomyces invadans]
MMPVCKPWAQNLLTPDSGAVEIQLTPAEEKLFEVLQFVRKKYAPSTTLRVAGGWVRDKVLGIPSDDIDIALDTMTGEAFVKKIVAFQKACGVPIKGFYIVKKNAEQSKHLECAAIKLLGQELDFVHLRSETYNNPNSRIPTLSGALATPKEDAMRRDITINALFYNLNTKTVEDFTGQGLLDLDRQIIRTPLAPTETFLDDPLRVLRAIRFASHYNFQLHSSIVQAMQTEPVQMALAQKVTRERVGIEVRKMLSGTNPAQALHWMRQTNLLQIVLPTFLRVPLDDSTVDATIRFVQATVAKASNVSYPTKDQFDHRVMLASALAPTRTWFTPADVVGSNDDTQPELAVADSAKRGEMMSHSNKLDKQHQPRQRWEAIKRDLKWSNVDAKHTSDVIEGCRRFEELAAFLLQTQSPAEYDCQPHTVCTRPELNNRLEMYVLRVKEVQDSRDVAEKELETIRERMQMDLSMTKTRLSKELEDTRKLLEFEIDQKTRLQVLEQEQHTELVKLRTQVKEFGDIRVELEQVQAELAKEKESSKAAKEALALQTTSLQSARRKLKDLDKENRKLTSSLSDTTNELDQLKQKTSEFSLTRDTEITLVRKEMNAKHLEALAAWRRESEERLHSVEAEVRAHFEGQIEQLRSQVDEVNLELDSLKVEYERTANDYDESLKIRQSLTDKLSTIETQYRNERKKFQEDRKMYEANIDNARQARLAKETEFNDLMDIKIALDAANHSKKRKASLTPVKSSTTRQHKRRKSHSTGVLRITYLNLEQGRITLENTGSDALSLSGWQVSSKATNVVFAFPEDYVIQPNGRVSVISGRNAAPTEEEKESMDFYVIKKAMWNTQADVAQLTNPSGDVVSSYAEGMYVDDDDVDAADTPAKDGVRHH